MTEKEFKDLLAKYLDGKADFEESSKIEQYLENLEKRDSDIAFKWIQNNKQTLKGDIKTSISGKVTPVKKIRKFNYIGIAASVVTLVGLGVGLWLILNQPPSYNNLVTQSNERKEITLEDGTRISLNANSQLQYLDSFKDSKQRRVRLQGEAFFVVADDPQKPFIVQTGDIETKVLGTEFNVKNITDTIEVSLLEGSVELHRGQQIKQLAPNQSGLWTTSSNNLQVLTFEPQQKLAWHLDSFEFENTSLAEVAAVLEKKFQVQISFEHQEIAEKKITASFENQDLKTILMMMTNGANLRYGWNQDGTLTIYSNQ